MRTSWFVDPVSVGRSQEWKNGSGARARDRGGRASEETDVRAHRRADTTKHAEPNAPVGAKAARSRQSLEPGHNGPACPQPYDSLHANARRGGVDQPTQGMRHSQVFPDEAWATSLGYAHHSVGAGAAFRRHESTRLATIPTRRLRKTRAGGHGLVDSRHVGPWKRDDIDPAHAHTKQLEPRSTPRHAGHQASARQCWYDHRHPSGRADNHRVVAARLALDGRSGHCTRLVPVGVRVADGGAPAHAVARAGSACARWGAHPHQRRVLEEP